MGTDVTDRVAHLESITPDDVLMLCGGCVNCFVDDVKIDHVTKASIKNGWAERLVEPYEIRLSEDSFITEIIHGNVTLELVGGS